MKDYRPAAIALRFGDFASEEGSEHSCMSTAPLASAMPIDTQITTPKTYRSSCNSEPSKWSLPLMRQLSRFHQQACQSGGPTGIWYDSPGQRAI